MGRRLFIERASPRKDLSLKAIYNKLYFFYGPQHWWPGETPFEIAVGAILTQNTNWINVEKAIANLRSNGVLSAKALHELHLTELASLIRPSGYYNLKAKRLRALIDFLMDRYEGSLRQMQKGETGTLRTELLSVNGIGQETADSILLYALDKPVFVIDAYTKRVLSRHGIMEINGSYQEYQEIFHRVFVEDVRLFNEYHALLVRLGKDYCRPQPRCSDCPLAKKRTNEL